MTELPLIGPLPDGWSAERFGDLLEDAKVRNGIYKAKPFHGTGARIVNMGELFGHPRLGDIEMKRLQVTPNELVRFGIQDGDLLFARRSLVADGAGKVCLALEVPEPTVFESSIIRARPRHRELSDYLYYVFSSPYGRHILDTIRRDAVVAGITGTDLVGLMVPVPPLSEQRRIAEILGALDDKIELNRKMNQTLEEMAQAIFNDALAGCDPSEGGVPIGWTLKTLGEAAKQSGGAVQTGPFGSQLHASDYVEHGIPSVMPKDLKDDRISTSDVARVPVLDAERLVKHRLVLGDVIYSRRGDVERRALVLEREVGWLCGTGCLRVRLGADSYNPHFLYQYLGLPTIRAWIVRHAQGATMPNLNTQILGSLPFCFPSHLEQERIGRIVGALHLKREANFSESETLAELRDTLLPKLISGELRVWDAQRTLEKAV